jgi:acetyl-CoA carboxylase biotin carboxyl carrier protein
MSDKDKNDEPMRVDTGLIKKLAEMLDENDLSEIEVEDNGRRIVVKRKLAGVAAAPAPAPAPPPPPAPAAAAAAPEGPDGPPRNGHLLESPMVGTVYLSPEPGSPPFIAVGQQVARGETILIIEAMKVMNPIEAPVAGKIAEILIENGQPVEYGQLLVVIE